MKKALAVICILVFSLFLIDAGLAQTRNYRAGILTVDRYIRTLRGAPILSNGYFEQTYSGTAKDAFNVDYTGMGNLLMNLRADGSSVFTLAKSGTAVFNSSEAGSYLIWDAANKTLNLVDVGGGTKNFRSVPEFDAVVDDDGTGDYATIEAALGAGAESIFIKEGIYNPASDLTLTSGVVLIGESRDKTVIDFNAQAYQIKSVGSTTTYSTGTLSVSTGSTTVTGAGTTWLGRTEDYIKLGSDWYEVSSIDADNTITLVRKFWGAPLSLVSYLMSDLNMNIVIRDLTITGSQADGAISFSYVNNSTIENCRIIDNISGTTHKDGIKFNYCDQNLIKGNHIRGCLDGIELDYSNNNSIIANVINNNDSEPINLENSHENIVSNNTLVNNDSGIWVYYSDKNIIALNTVKNTDGAGIEFQHSDNLVIEGNTVTYSDGNGIYCSGTTDYGSSIVGNTVSYNDGHGISVQGTHQIVSGNTVNNNSSNGIALFSSDIVADGNTVYDNTHHGIHTYRGSNFVISSNSIRDNVMHGIYLQGTQHSQISGNVVVGNDSGDSATYDGICLDVQSAYYASYNTVSNNRCQDNDRYEISIVDANCTSNQLLDNNTYGTDHVDELSNAGTGTIINEYDYGDSKYNVSTDVDVAGHVAIGNNATIQAQVVSYLDEVITETSGNFFGAEAILTPIPASESDAHYMASFGQVFTDTTTENFTGAQYGVYGYSRTKTSGNVPGWLFGCYGIGSNNGVGNLVDEAYGVWGRLENDNTGTITLGAGVGAKIQNDSTGEITTAYGLYAKAQNTGTIGTLHGVHVEDPVNSGTITTNIGMYVGPQTAGSTNYALYSAGGNSYHVGDIELARDSANTTFTVSGHADDEGTTPKLVLRKSDNTGASPAPVDQSAVLGTINFDGYDNDSYETGASIHVVADANWGAAERSTDMFFATRDGAGGLTDQFSINAAGDFQGVTSKWWYCSYISMLEVSPGGSGAVWTHPDANTIGGHQLDVSSEHLDFSVRVCPNWDASSDLRIGFFFEVNVNNVGGLVTDTVDLQLLCYYKGIGDISSKTQTLEVATVVGQSPQYKVFQVLFIIDYNPGGGNDVEIMDTIAFEINLETDTSEVDDVILNFGAFAFRTADGFIQISDTP